MLAENLYSSIIKTASIKLSNMLKHSGNASSAAQIPTPTPTRFVTDAEFMDRVMTPTPAASRPEPTRPVRPPKPPSPGPKNPPKSA